MLSSFSNHNIIIYNQTLDVSRNDINDIPAELGLIDTLQKLLVDGNMIVFVSVIMKNCS